MEVPRVGAVEGWDASVESVEPRLRVGDGALMLAEKERGAGERARGYSWLGMDLDYQTPGQEDRGLGGVDRSALPCWFGGCFRARRRHSWEFSEKRAKTQNSVELGTKDCMQAMKPTQLLHAYPGL